MSRKSALPYEPRLYEQELSTTYVFVATIEDSSSPLKIDFEGHVVSAVWSPTGDRVAAMVANSSLVDDFYMTRRLQVADALTGRRTAIIPHDGKKGSFSWSPNGKQLAFIAGADINDPIDGRLFVVSSDGNDLRNVDPDYEGQFHHVEWVNDQSLRYLASQRCGI